MKAIMSQTGKKKQSLKERMESRDAAKMNGNAPPSPPLAAAPFNPPEAPTDEEALSLRPPSVEEKKKKTKLAPPRAAASAPAASAPAASAVAGVSVDLRQMSLPETTEAESGTEEEKEERRGRPKGSKNKSKDDNEPGTEGFVTTTALQSIAWLNLHCAAIQGGGHPFLMEQARETYLAYKKEFG